MYFRIRALREDKDLKQVDIANYLNITQKTYSRYERGDRSIPIDMLCKIADYHGTSTDYLLERTDIKKPYIKRKNELTDLLQNHNKFIFYYII